MDLRKLFPRVTVAIVALSIWSTSTFAQTRPRVTAPGGDDVNEVSCTPDELAVLSTAPVADTKPVWETKPKPTIDLSPSTGSTAGGFIKFEPQIQEVLGIDERGHDYFLQVTDARPDTGGLSGATPGEAVSWGKVDPDRLPDAVVCYVDSTVALPLITAYALTRHEPREPKRLYEKRDQFMNLLLAEYKKSKRR